MNGQGAPRLNSSLLSGLGLRRPMKPGHTQRQDWVDASYDVDTFWYDAFWDGRRVVLVCPKLFGLRDRLKAAEFRLDGAPARRVRFNTTRERFDTIRLRARARPRELRVVLDGREVASPVASAPEDARWFVGRNCAVTLSRDNDLDWIEDFARYHRQVHGLEQMLFFDNGSTRYELPEITAALRRAGLTDPVVLSAPFKYGLTTLRPNGKPTFSTQFLQTALLHIARRRFLSSARAVLQCDIDELVWCAGGSVFDKAADSLFGFVHLGVEWRYPAAGLGGRARHADHVYARPGDDLCRAKYCVRPTGPLGFSDWHVHALGLHRRGTRIPPRGAGVWHCNAIRSSAWRDVAENAPGDLQEDAAARGAFAALDWSEGR